MFSSDLNYKDLIFQDSTVRLVSVDKDQQNYNDYLGTSFVRAMERMNNIDCVTGKSSLLHASPVILLLILAFIQVILCL